MNVYGLELSRCSLNGAYFNVVLNNQQNKEKDTATLLVLRSLLLKVSNEKHRTTAVS